MQADDDFALNSRLVKVDTLNGNSNSYIGAYNW